MSLGGRARSSRGPSHGVLQMAGNVIYRGNGCGDAGSPTGASRRSASSCRSTGSAALRRIPPAPSLAPRPRFAVENIHPHVSAVNVTVGQTQHVVHPVQKRGGFKAPAGGCVECVTHDHLVNHHQQQRHQQDHERHGHEDEQRIQQALDATVEDGAKALLRERPQRRVRGHAVELAVFGDEEDATTHRRRRDGPEDVQLAQQPGRGHDHEAKGAGDGGAEFGDGVIDR